MKKIRFFKKNWTVVFYVVYYSHKNKTDKAIEFSIQSTTENLKKCSGLVHGLIEEIEKSDSFEITLMHETNRSFKWTI